MRKLTREVFEELTEKPIKSLKDVELAQLRRSNRGGSILSSEVIAEQRRRGLLDPRTDKELIKNLGDYPDEDAPIQHYIDVLQDFHMPLEMLKEHIDQLIEQYGPRAQIFVDGGYNNVSIYVETSPAIPGWRVQQEQQEQN